MIEKVYVTWKEVEDFVDDITALYKNSNISGVYGLPRGGLILAVMLSHRLNIPMLMSPCENCLIVDDICDSGESLLHYYKDSSSEDKPDWTIVSMFYKENILGVHPAVYKYKKQDKWIVFPWEERKEN